MVIRIVLLITVCLLIGCTTPGSPSDRRKIAAETANIAGWHPLSIQVRDFELMAYVPNQKNLESVVTIYIEGDGAAWVNRFTPSKDPTPKDPIALRLALAQPDGYAVYLGRPCQYVPQGSKGCNVQYWTQARFSEPVIVAMNDAIDVLKAKTGSSQVRLVGFSGGGAIATLVAARRSDVVQLTTVSGNLNTAAWTSFHGLSGLEGLDPISATSRLQTIPQVHFVGSKDTNTTSELIMGFIQKIPKPNKAKLIIKDGNTHNCCWADQWPNLWQDVTSTLDGAQ